MNINTNVLIYCPQTRTIKKMVISANTMPVNLPSEIENIDKKLDDNPNFFDRYEDTTSTSNRKTRKQINNLGNENIIVENKRNDYTDRRKNNNIRFNEEDELDALINSNKKKLDNAQVMSDKYD
jgi:hypothetical protein